jgi:GTPase Era involved in 16S rRNA processing
MLPQERYKKLKEYLSVENPVLLDVIDKYKELDDIGYKVGLLEDTQTYTESISWWPMISILGTFSAGKSTFINEYLGRDIQQSGNQAVDDKFTAICYGNSQEAVVLPGLALDADPRFPFYNISEEVNKVDPGEGGRVNSYLQLKTLKSPQVKGKILIDSPGFDADSQRDAILKITSHIVEMSDLVLIFFDARHPEPGAMRDTLEHLVGTTIKHRDATKVLYILNQIDTTAKQDNLEDVMGSWQRALSQEGLVSGDFYGIYSKKAAEQIDDDALRERLESKRDADLAKILDRMDKVSIERAYRIVKALDDFAKDIKEKQLPLLKKELESWRSKIVIGDLVIIALLAAAGVAIHLQYGIWNDLNIAIAGGVGAFVVWLLSHIKISSFLAKRAAKKYEKDDDNAMAMAILKNTTFIRSLFGIGKKWYSNTINRIDNLIGKSKLTIQKLNDQFVSPSGAMKQESNQGN